MPNGLDFPPCMAAVSIDEVHFTDSYLVHVETGYNFCLPSKASYKRVLKYASTGMLAIITDDVWNIMMADMPPNR